MDINKKLVDLVLDFMEASGIKNMVVNFGLDSNFNLPVEVKEVSVSGRDYYGFSRNSLILLVEKPN